MPTYIYECENCKAMFECKHSIHRPPRRKCPDCGKFKLFRVIQPVMGFVKKSDNQLKTLGDLASRNADRMSDDYKQHLTEKNRTKPVEEPKELPRGMTRISPDGDTPFYQKGQDLSNKKLARLTPEQKERYIKTGKV